ncbi:hypothetical protein CSUI_008346 [Cystoisospora suis]|uniref:Uncharacterized protein n=1 Tax=Cystoisospora suis TaxID=483139 RepID=A0A2C6KJW0_9APIC|nr:hypothetical protein CSUI_008346 [Cystoisospora suis]
MEPRNSVNMSSLRGRSSLKSAHSSSVLSSNSGLGEGFSSQLSSYPSAQTTVSISSATRNESRPLPTKTSSLSGKSDRLHRLEQRLSGLHAGLEKQRQQRYQHLVEKLRQLEQEVSEATTSGNEAHAFFREELKRVEEELKERQVEVNSDMARREQQAQEMEHRLTKLLQNEQEALREVESSLMNSFTEKAKALR